MANRFHGGVHSMSLSNGATDVFLSVLEFALSNLAVNPRERALAPWIARLDQNLGLGCVGFRLEEIAWERPGSPVNGRFS